MKSLSLLALPALLLCATAGLAQEDDQTRDHEERDRLYQQRRLQQQTRQPAHPVDDEARLAAFLGQADELIRDRNYASDSSEHYRVQTDDPRLRAATATRLLESFRTYFDGFWPESVELQPYDEVSRSFLFYSFYKFNQLLDGDFRFRTFRPKGHYGSDLDVITLHTDAGDGGALADSLIHEAAHQLVMQRLFGGGQLPALWVNEGLAAYFGFTLADEQGAFQRAFIGGKSAVLIKGSTKDPGIERKQSLKRAKDGLRAAGKQSVGLIERIVSIDGPDEFYGNHASLNYAASWMLVHFLLHGEDGTHATAFQRYLDLERQGRGGPAAFYETVELAPDQLEASVAAHAKSLKAR